MKFVCSLGEAKGEDRGQMKSIRMEEQTVTAELKAAKITKEDAIGKKNEVEGRRGKGDEGQE